MLVLLCSSVQTPFILYFKFWMSGSRTNRENLTSASVPEPSKLIFKWLKVQQISYKTHQGALSCKQKLSLGHLCFSLSPHYWLKFDSGPWISLCFSFSFLMRRHSYCAVMTNLLFCQSEEQPHGWYCANCKFENIICIVDVVLSQYVQIARLFFCQALQLYCTCLCTLLYFITLK